MAYAWGQERLDQLFVNSGSGGTPLATNPNFYNGPIPFLGIADITDREITSTKKSITELGLKNSAAWIVPAGSVSLAMYASVGKVGITTKDLATSQAFYNMVFDDDFLRDFVYTRLEKADMDREWEALISTGTQRNLNAEKVRAFTIDVPSHGEMIKIAGFFKNIDSLLSLHQRKLDKLQAIKKSLLQKMFPAEGEDRPQIRFAGYTDAWGQERLGDMGETFTGLSGKSKEDFGHGNAKFVTYMNVYLNPIADLKMLESVEVDNKQTKVQYGDMFFTTSSETAEEVGMSSIWLGNIENLYLNSFCFGYRLSKKMDPYFMGYLMRSPEIRNKFIFLAQGISRYNISKNHVMEMEVTFPSLEEQKKIGQLLYSVDSLLSLHQRKLEKLQQIKKALLEQMFC